MKMSIVKYFCSVKHWIAAFRLKTLPLAFGAIILGSALRAVYFSWVIFSLAAFTAILLQVLSNLANDYGDFVKGTDKHRTDRQLAGGHITPCAMLVALVLFCVLTLASGILLLNTSFGTSWKYWLQFFGIGLASIVAAITYTVGKKAYGYNGLGDLFVFIFFGLVGVLGTSFLFHQELSLALFFPAVAYGCLCMGVLNVNNIRDLDKDVLTNKITLAAKLGKQGALRYQDILMGVALVSFVAHHFIEREWSLAPFVLAIAGVLHHKKLSMAETSTDYNVQLKFLSIASLVVAIVFIFKII